MGPERSGAAVDSSRVVWRKSSRSGAAGCVEVAFIDEHIAVRDSKDPHGPVLLFSAREWTAFVDGVREGEFSLRPGLPTGYRASR